jgi:hypothetical protein
MRRRKLLVVLAGLVALVAVAAGAFALWPREDRVTRENFDHLQVGMSRAEVDAIAAENYKRIKLGMRRARVEAMLGPPGDYRMGPTGSRVALELAGTWLGSQAVTRTDTWITDTLEIQVLYGPSDDAVLARAFVLQKKD